MSKASLTCCLCGQPAHDPVDLATDRGRGWIEELMRDGAIRQGKFSGRIMHEKGACKFAPEHGDPAVKANRAIYQAIGFEIKDDSGWTALKEGKTSKAPTVEVRKPGPDVVAAVEAAANAAPVARNAAGKPTRATGKVGSTVAPPVTETPKPIGTTYVAPIKVEAPPVPSTPARNGSTVSVDVGLLSTIIGKLPREALIASVLSGMRPTILVSIGDREWTLSAADVA